MGLLYLALKDIYAELFDADQLPTILPSFIHYLQELLATAPKRSVLYVIFPFLHSVILRQVVRPQKREVNTISASEFLEEQYGEHLCQGARYLRPDPSQQAFRHSRHPVWWRCGPDLMLLFSL